MRRVLALFALLTSAFVVLVVVPGAAAGDTPCIGALTGPHDNVVVPPNQSCIVSAATVRGSVKALQDSRLRITAASNVRGNVEGDKADIVQVDNSTVGGNIVVKEGGPAVAPAPGFFFCAAFVPPSTPCEAVVLNSTVENGNVQIEKMQGDVVVRGNGIFSLSPIMGNVQIFENFTASNEFLSIDTNTVTHNVQVSKIKGPGSKFVLGNTVMQNLQCFENDPPFFGAPNVAGQAQGQCTASPLPMSFAFSLPALIDVE